MSADGRMLSALFDLSLWRGEAAWCFLSCQRVAQMTLFVLISRLRRSGGPHMSRKDATVQH
jgi:hypothetical protein